MLRFQASAAVLLLLALPASGARMRSAAEDLLQVVTPAAGETASAHPDVNVIVAFGTAADGTAADPATFRAWFRGREITGRFAPIVVDGVETGRRTVLEGGSLRPGRTRNRLRLLVDGVRSGTGKRARLRDKDRVRFGATDAPNQPPVAVLAAGATTATLGVAVAFDARGSADPDLDALEVAWTFSDGGTAEGLTPAHAFGAASDGFVEAAVHVSDGQATVDETLRLPTRLEVDPGRVPGTVRVEGPALEFSATPLGSTATRTLTVRNVDETPESQVKVRATVSPATFVVADALHALGPGESVDLDVAFTPTVDGHAAGRVVLVFAAANRDAVTLLAHGHGGAAAGDGPSGIGAPVFGLTGGDVLRIAPDGGTAVLDLGTGTCSLTGDVCVADGDCATAGETCTASASGIDVAELCTDGSSLFVVSEDSFTDPREDPETELSGTLVRFDLDAAGEVTVREVLYRTTEDTTHLACDPVPAGEGGLAYLAEFRNVVGSASCDRDERDALVSVNKGTGNARTVAGFSRMDAAAGVPECAFRDPVAALELGSDGIARFAGFDAAGLWRIGPTPLPFTPDVSDRFQIHPDGSVAFAVARDRGVAGAIELYRITAAQVEHGALALSALTPCATFMLPNNAEREAHGLTLAASFVLAPAAAGGRAAIGLASFASRPATGASGVLPPFGDVRGTVAFSLPPETTSCALDGLVTLQAHELAR
jgi:hypothetical protein